MPAATVYPDESNPLRMKATKISFNTKILSLFLWLIGLLALATSCDVFEDDPDLHNPDAQLIENEVHVYSKNTSIIDLNTLIRTNHSVRLELTSLTHKGELTNLGKGLLQYVPANKSAKVEDWFKFSVYSADNNVLQTDSVVIIVENDSTELPCGVFPIDDYVYNISRDSTVSINVLGNDIFCSNDSADIKLSVYRPTNEFPPYSGYAEVIDNMIIYHPGSSFNGFDKIIYRIENPDGSAAFGFVYIQSVQTCVFELNPDSYVVHADSASVLLHVFENDTICETYIAIDEWNIFMEPNLGTATISPNGIRFVPADTLHAPITYDSIGYELCFDTVCYRTKVLLEINNN